MSAKPVLRRAAARADIDAAADYYDREAGADVALRVADAVEAAIRAIAEWPGASSAIWGERLRIPGLRSRPVAGFPFLVFYVEHDAHIEVRRVLHAKRDIPKWLPD